MMNDEYGMMNDEYGMMNDEEQKKKDSSFIIHHSSFFNRQQILIWQRMSPVERLEVAFQAYQFALDAVRLTERQRHPDLSEEELRWRVIRRVQANQQLGREKDARSSDPPRAE
jgi:hypothetical protein